MKSRYFFTALAVLILTTAQLAVGTALDDYVAAPDANYNYNVVKTVPGPGYRNRGAARTRWTERSGSTG